MNLLCFLRRNLFLKIIDEYSIFVIQDPPPPPNQPKINIKNDDAYGVQITFEIKAFYQKKLYCISYFVLESGKNTCRWKYDLSNKVADLQIFI